MITKMKTKDIKPMREEMLSDAPQCSLCGSNMLTKTRVALDHCHITGRIRAPLCGWCNSQLGKIENAAIRAVGKDRMLEFLLNSVEYVKHHRENPSNYEHPTHNKPKKRRKN